MLERNYNPFTCVRLFDSIDDDEMCNGFSRTILFPLFSSFHFHPLRSAVGLRRHALPRHNPRKLSHTYIRIEKLSYTEKILQLADNPESREATRRKTLISTLEQENKQLRERLLASSSSSSSFSSSSLSGSGGGVLPASSFKALEMECEKLRGLVDEKEKRLGRLKEVYRIKALEYREAVYSLLGYRLDFLSEGIVRLRSMYASDDSPPSSESTSTSSSSSSSPGLNNNSQSGLDFAFKFVVGKGGEVESMQLIEGVSSSAATTMRGAAGAGAIGGDGLKAVREIVEMHAKAEQAGATS
ncbi:coiled-coil domain-containing protein mad1, partial [Quaeritorhiza haematococci]